MAHLPDKVLAEFGEPETRSATWASWKHGCPTEGKRYNGLLYSFRTGWLMCRACGLRKGPQQLGHRPDPVRIQPPSVARARELMPEVWHAPSFEQGYDVWKYLHCKRGMTREEIAEHVLVNPLVSDYATFPIMEDGVMVSWHARYCGLAQDEGGAPWIKRYLSPFTPDEGWLQTAETCWGLDRIDAGYPVYVTEGIFDALYFTRGVAFMGGGGHGGNSVGCTEQQRIKVLDRNPSRVIIVLDDDEAGRARIPARIRDWKRLNRWMDVRVMAPKGGKDFGALVAEGKRQRRQA